MAEPIVAAPPSLGLDDREAFRAEADRALGSMTDAGGRLVIDLGATRTMDSAGLGALLLIQRRAAERRIPVVLRNPTSDMRYLLLVTRLDGLFTIEPPGAEPAR